ncbi:MAG TPA: SDR family oxidoreductase [Thermomicrobiaceae bacterium]|nr:SDR family oxidoreductase [Thermomicrobiaceae bacterium]
MPLTGKVALVTGSSSGIGKAIAIRLAHEGCDVCVNYHREEAAAQDTVQQIQGLGRKAIAVQADMGASTDVQAMVGRCETELGGLDIMVNNAGVEIKAPFIEVTEEHWDLVVHTNLKGVFFGMQAAARYMVPRRSGRIINISSIHEDATMPGNAPYCAAKGGVRMLMRTVAVELAPYGITVNNVAPGAIMTPINRDTLSDPAKVAALEAVIPMARIGTPDDVAGVVVFLASDDAAYVTGATYFVDGGMIRQFSNE